jgi:hypothetical protein
VEQSTLKNRSTVLAAHSAAEMEEWINKLIEAGNGKQTEPSEDLAKSRERIYHREDHVDPSGKMI